MSKETYRGLQAEFEHCLRAASQVSSTNKPLMSSELLDLALRDPKISQRPEEQRKFLENNLPNFLRRAVDHGLLVGHGRKRGYSYAGAPVGDPARAGTEEPSAACADDEVAVTRSGKKSKKVQREAFLHFPVTLLLAHKFRALVASQPCKSQNGQYSNQDMLMIRDRYDALHQDGIEMRNGDLEGLVKSIQRADSAPRYIVSAIELKYAVANRRELLNAIAQAMAQGSWANETWVAYTSEEDFSEDRNVRAVASQVGVGLVQITLPLQDEEPPDEEVRMEIVNFAATKDTFGLDSGVSVDTLGLTAKLIEEFDKKGSYLDVSDDVSQQVVTLLRQALENLGHQPGFMKMNDYEDALSRIGDGGIDMPRYICGLRKQLIQTVGLDEDWEKFVPRIEQHVNESLSKNEGETLMKKLRILGLGTS